MLVNIGISVLLVLVIVAGWAVLSRRRPSPSRRTDGAARIEGACGSTLEIGLVVESGRVVRSVYRAEGCGYNCTCLHAGARLARGKPPRAILDIDANAILKAAGDVPEDHHHCAEMAARALHAASEDYMLKIGASVSPSGPAAAGGQQR